VAHIKTVTRYHDISCGHRVVGHEGACAGLHGHNYRIHFTCVAPDVDAVGRVIDFSVIKSKLCLWLEYNWDHKMLLWEKDPILEALDERMIQSQELNKVLDNSIYVVPFNPLAEQMAAYLLEIVGPEQLTETGVTLTRVTVDETRKCSATASLL